MTDQELTMEDQCELFVHMEDCPECSAMYEVFTQLSGIIADDTAELPEGLHENMMANIRRIDLKNKNTAKAKLAKKRKKPIYNLIAAAACAVLVIASAATLIPSKNKDSSVIKSSVKTEAASAASNESSLAADMTPTPAPIPVTPVPAAPAQNPSASVNQQYDPYLAAPTQAPQPVQNPDAYLAATPAPAATLRPVFTPAPTPVPTPTSLWDQILGILNPVSSPAPTAEPTVEPTAEPTAEPTVVPTAEPTVEPTVEPTIEPTVEPTVEPTIEPTIEPTVEPTVEPTAEPTPEPSTETEEEAESESTIGGILSGILNIFNGSEDEKEPEADAEPTPEADAEPTPEPEMDSAEDSEVNTEEEIPNEPQIIKASPELEMFAKLFDVKLDKQPQTEAVVGTQEPEATESTVTQSTVTKPVPGYFEIKSDEGSLNALLMLLGEDKFTTPVNEPMSLFVVSSPAGKDGKTEKLYAAAFGEDVYYSSLDKGAESRLFKASVKAADFAAYIQQNAQALPAPTAGTGAGTEIK